MATQVSDTVVAPSANLSSPHNSPLQAHNNNASVNPIALFIKDEEICKNKRFELQIGSVEGSPLKIIAFDKRKCSLIYEKESISKFSDTRHEETVGFTIENEQGEAVIQPQSIKIYRDIYAPEIDPPTLSIPLVISNLNSKQPSDLVGSYMVARSQHFCGKAQITKFGKLPAVGNDVEVIDLEEESEITAPNGSNGIVVVAADGSDEIKKRKFASFNCPHPGNKPNGYCHACYEEYQQAKQIKTENGPIQHKPSPTPSNVQQALQDSSASSSPSLSTPPTSNNNTITINSNTTPSSNISVPQLQNLLQNQILLQNQLLEFQQEYKNPVLNEEQKAKLIAVIHNIQTQLRMYDQVLQHQWVSTSTPDLISSAPSSPSTPSSTPPSTPPQPAILPSTPPQPPISPSSQAVPLPPFSSTMSLPTTTGTPRAHPGQALMQQSFQIPVQKGPRAIQFHIPQTPDGMKKDHKVTGVKLSAADSEKLQKRSMLLEYAKQHGTLLEQALKQFPHLRESRTTQPTSTSAQQPQQKMVQLGMTPEQVEAAKQVMRNTIPISSAKPQPTQPQQILPQQTTTSQSQPIQPQQQSQQQLQQPPQQAQPQVQQPILQQQLIQHQQLMQQQLHQQQLQQQQLQLQKQKQQSRSKITNTPAVLRPAPPTKPAATLQPKQPVQVQQQRIQPVQLTHQQLNTEIQNQSQHRAFNYCHMKVLQHQMFLQQHIQKQRLPSATAPAAKPPAKSTPTNTNPAAPTTVATAALTAALAAALTKSPIPTSPPHTTASATVTSNSSPASTSTTAPANPASPPNGVSASSPVTPPPATSPFVASSPAIPPPETSPVASAPATSLPPTSETSPPAPSSPPSISSPSTSPPPTIASPETPSTATPRASVSSPITGSPKPEAKDSNLESSPNEETKPEAKSEPASESKSSTNSESMVESKLEPTPELKKEEYKPDNQPTPMDTSTTTTSSSPDNSSPMQISSPKLESTVPSPPIQPPNTTTSQQSTPQSATTQPTSPQTTPPTTTSTQPTPQTPTPPANINKYSVDAWTSKIINCRELQWLKQTVDFYSYAEK